MDAMKTMITTAVSNSLNFFITEKGLTFTELLEAAHKHTPPPYHGCLK